LDEISEVGRENRPDESGKSPVILTKASMIPRPFEPILIHRSGFLWPEKLSFRRQSVRGGKILFRIEKFNKLFWRLVRWSA
jgi:hypothetical protein